MGSGKIKDAWPIWALVIAGVLVIILAVNQNKVEKEAVSVGQFLNSDSNVLASYTVDPTGSKAAQALEDPVASPAIVASPESGNQVMYAIQLYSFKDQAKADAMSKSINESGIAAYVQMSDLGDKGIWYRVRTGSFNTPDKAQAMLTEIRKQHKESIVVKEKK
jgi:cell division septation protein DedD